MAKESFTKLQKVWYYGRRLLRTLVPQIPAFLSFFETIFPKEAVPFLMLAGGLLTTLDKWMRDNGYYNNIIPLKF